MGVGGFFLGFFELGEEFAEFFGVFGLGGEVGEFVGVGLEVEELGFVDLGVADDLPAVVAEGTLDLGVGGKEGVAEAGFLPRRRGEET